MTGEAEESADSTAQAPTKQEAFKQAAKAEGKAADADAVSAEVCAVLLA